MPTKFINAINLDINPLQPKWKRYRSLDDIKYLVVHQTGGSLRTTFRTQQYDHQTITPGVGLAWNNKDNYPNGLPTLSYHFWVSGNGEIYQANKLTANTITVKGNNTSVVSVAFSGNYPAPGYNGKDVLTNAQKEAFLWLVPRLLKKLRLSPTRLVGHSQLQGDKTACPGSELMKMIEDFQSKSLEIAEQLEQSQKEARDIGIVDSITETVSDTWESLKTGFGKWLEVRGITMDQIMVLGQSGSGLDVGSNVNVIIDPVSGKPYVTTVPSESSIKPPQKCKMKSTAEAGV